MSETTQGLVILFGVIATIVLAFIALFKSFTTPYSRDSQDVIYTNRSDVFHATGDIGYPKSDDEKKAAYAAIEKAESLITTETPILDVHFLYQQKIELHYRDRELAEHFDLAVAACKQQISISALTIPAFMAELGRLPSHVGYKQLCIILERQGDYDDVIRLCKQAMSQGWHGDWEKRIAKIIKRKRAK